MFSAASSRAIFHRLPMFSRMSGQNVMSKANRNVFTSFTRGFQSQAARSANPGTFNTARLGITLGLVGSAGSFIARPHFLNDAGALGSKVASNIQYDIKSATGTHGPDYDGAFEGKLDYRKLALGSTIGLILGVIAGKLSSALVFLSVVGYLSFQFLHNRGVISVPFTKVVKIGGQYFDLRHMFLEEPSFNVTFLLTFVVAAMNL